MTRLRALALTLALAGCGEREAAVPAPTLPRPATLVLAGDEEAWVVDVDTGTVQHRTHVEQLPPGDPPHRLVWRGDRFVTWGYATHTFDARFANPRVLVEDTWIMVPAAEPDRVWLGFLEPGQPNTSVRLAAVREVKADGEVTVPDVPPPDGQWPSGEVDEGLLFERPDGLHVWDPRTRADVRVVELGDDQLAAAHRDWITACGWPCPELRLIDSRTAAERRIRVPDGAADFHAHESAFSPDGSRLAVTVSAGREEAADRQLALVDTATGTVRTVPGSEVPAGYVMAAWSASGDQVFLTGGERFRQRTIVAHRLGAPRARRLDVAVGDFYDVAAR